MATFYYHYIEPYWFAVEYKEINIFCFLFNIIGLNSLNNLVVFVMRLMNQVQLHIVLNAGASALKSQD